MNLTTTERYQAFVEATKYQLLHELEQLEQSERANAEAVGNALDARGYMFACAATRQAANAIEQLDPAEITRKVIDLLYGGVPPIMTTTPPTKAGYYWFQRRGRGEKVIVFVASDPGNDPWITMFSKCERQLSGEMFSGALWSLDPITPPGESNG